MKPPQRARLIPTSGIRGTQEAEQRATSALLAVIGVVCEYSRDLLGDLGASKAKTADVATFVEVVIKMSDGTKVRPDGLINVTYGKKSWTALVEVKTGSATLEADQLNRYLDAAKLIDADQVISISNEVGIAGEHPTPGLKVRSNSKVKIHHFSWSALLASAIRCREHTGVSDPEQSWILSELIRYLEHPSAGVTDFSDMGPNWGSVRSGVRKGTLQKSSSGLDEIATKWDELIRHLTLRLSAQTGADVSHVLPRAQQNARDRLNVLRTSLLEDGCMSSVLRIPNTVGDVTITADLRSGQVITDVAVDAPGDRKARGSIGWLTRQLKDAPGDLHLEAFAKYARSPEAASLSDVFGDPVVLLDDSQTDIVRFRLASHRDAGRNRRNGGKSPGFIESVNAAFDEFYELVVQRIDAWTEPAPKIRTIDLDEPFSGSNWYPTNLQLSTELRVSNNPELMDSPAG